MARITSRGPSPGFPDDPSRSQRIARHRSTNSSDAASGRSAPRSRISIHPRSIAISTGTSRSAARWCHAIRALVSDTALGNTVDTLVATFDARTAPLLDSLPRAAVHGDLNDRNVLVGGGSDVESSDQSVTGIVDFGDMTYSFRVADLAIAIAYAILGSDDPLAVSASIVRGYRETMAITDQELAALFGLVAMRLCTSVCIAADQQQQRPDNDYLGVSQSAMRTRFRFSPAFPSRLPRRCFERPLEFRSCRPPRVSRTFCRANLRLRRCSRSTRRASRASCSTSASQARFSREIRARTRSRR